MRMQNRHVTLKGYIMITEKVEGRGYIMITEKGGGYDHKKGRGQPISTYSNSSLLMKFSAGFFSFSFEIQDTICKLSIV